MRICRVKSLFAVFAGFAVAALPKDEFDNHNNKEAVIKSAVSAASLGFAGERRGRASSRLDHGFLNSSSGSAGRVNPAKATKSAITRRLRIQITHL